MDRVSSRHLWLIPLVTSLFLLGYYRALFFHFIGDIFYSTLPSNYLPETKFPSQLQAVFAGIGNNHLWLGSLIYSMVFSIHAAIAVWVVYESLRLAWYTILLYFLLSFCCLVLILLGNALGSFTLGYGLARHIRFLMESPFFLIFILAALRLFRMPQY
jgi:hypothetical protein